MLSCRLKKLTCKNVADTTLKEPSHFRKLESKLCDNKTEIKIVKVEKMIEFIKTCHQCPRKFNFGHFVGSIILPPFCWGKIDFQKTLFRESG